MRKLAALGTALFIGGSLLGGAAPVQAQPTPPPVVVDCGTLISPVCGALIRQLQNIEDELAQVPGYVQHLYNTLYALYTTADATVRCVVFQQC